MKLAELPESIQELYPNGFYKAEKKGSSTIVVYTNDKVKETYKKAGKDWVKQASTDLKDPPPPPLNTTRLFGTRLPPGLVKG